MRYKIANRMFWQYCGETAYLIDEKEQKVYELAGTATVVWKTLENNFSLHEIQKFVYKYYRIKSEEHQKINDEVYSFIEKLMDHGFLEKLNDEEAEI